ncbi:MAG: hypothetical protein KAS32_23185 [Candidatus Peribacteraceae bacterium]|nr:hypothetical protein [Candidatus Peribacteraceae bacterium]
MNKETVIDFVKYIGIVILVYVCVWGVGKLFADSVSDYKVIQPKEGIECVVVSRMFNTSVDCWKDI